VGFSSIKLDKGWTIFKKDHGIQDKSYTKELLVQVAKTKCNILTESFSCAPLRLGHHFLRSTESTEETWSKIPKSKKRALVEASAANKVINLYVCYYFRSIANTILD